MGLRKAQQGLYGACGESELGPKGKLPKMYGAIASQGVFYREWCEGVDCGKQTSPTPTWTDAVQKSGDRIM
jgi:hypothetical protein